jgi:signal transduction histidine kinase
LLLLAQAETGRLPLAEEPLELDTLLLEVYQQARMLAGEGVRVELGEEDQARVVGDEDRLKQVLLNLVTNALDHTPAGGRITLGLSREGEWATVRVADTGSGIPEEELPYIFERFYRVDRARKRRERGGAGLGLSIAYWITRMHGGNLEVESKLGEGTVFKVRLPLEGRVGGARRDRS